MLTVWAVSIKCLEMDKKIPFNGYFEITKKN
jgi:hypothetical protein